MPSKLKKSKNRLNDFIFDDCPICQAMKEAGSEGRNLTEPELMEAFKKVENRNKS